MNEPDTSYKYGLAAHVHLQRLRADPGHAWPAQHPELAVVCWSLALLVIFAPLAVRLYGNKVR